jgi:hypothetical protein
VAIAKDLSLEAPMSSRTIFLSRLLGLFLLAVSLSLFLRRPEMLAVMSALIQNAPLLLFLSLAALAAGLAIVLSHNIWSGGALPVVVTLFGWVILLRGLFLLMLPHEMIVRLFEMSRFPGFFYVYATVPLILGLYLTFAGFTASVK